MSVIAIETVTPATTLTASATLTIAGPVAATDRVVVVVAKTTTAGTPTVSGLGATWVADVSNTSLLDHYVFSATGITAGGVITVNNLSTTETDLTGFVLHSSTGAQVRFLNGEAVSATLSTGVVEATTSASANAGAFVIASAMTTGGVLDFPEATTTPASGWSTVRSSSISGSLRRRVIGQTLGASAPVLAAAKTTAIATLAVLRAAYWDDAVVAPYKWDQVNPASVAANPTITVAPILAAGDVFLVVDIGLYDSTAQHGSALSGLGVSAWTRIAAAQSVFADAWVGTAGSNLPGGQVLTLTAAAPPNYYNYRRLLVYCFRGITETALASAVLSAAGVTGTTSSITADSGQVVVAYGLSDSVPDSLKNLVPATGWAAIESFDSYPTFPISHSYRQPSTSEGHTASSYRLSGTSAVHVVRLGDGPVVPTGYIGWGSPMAV